MTHTSRQSSLLSRLVAVATATASLLGGLVVAGPAFADDGAQGEQNSQNAQNAQNENQTGQNGETANTVPAGAVAMYRLYNPHSGEHFYTANKAERENLLYVHWKDEGIGWYAPSKSSTPVYRLYNKNAGDHHYTMNSKERDALVKLKWSYEGIGWYSDSAKTIPLYRQYNPHARAGSHNYTTNKGENDLLVTKGWKAEGIGWYALAKGQTQQPVTMEQDNAYASIDALMKLNGTGTGYHTKIDISSGTGVVVSFGIQYEKDMHLLGDPRFAKNTEYLAENVMANATKPGPEGKEYLYLDTAERNKNARVRLSWYKDNTVKFFVNDHEIGRTRTKLEPPFIFSVEGSVARNGDTIDSYISDVRVKVGDDATSYGTMGEWDMSFNYFGLRAMNSRFGAKKDTQDAYATHGGHTFGSDFVFRGKANIPGKGPDKQPWTWDTSFSAVEPNTKTKGHPLSALAALAQYRPSNNTGNDTDGDTDDGTNTGDGTGDDSGKDDNKNDGQSGTNGTGSTDGNVSGSTGDAQSEQSDGKTNSSDE